MKAFRLMVNRSVTWADWDEDLLAIELLELKDLDFDLSLTGFDLSEIDAYMASGVPTEGLTDEDAVPEIAERAISVAGDLWVLGNHRVMCGDATVTADVSVDGRRRRGLRVHRSTVQRGLRGLHGGAAQDQRRPHVGYCLPAVSRGGVPVIPGRRQTGRLVVRLSSVLVAARIPERAGECRLQRPLPDHLGEKHIRLGLRPVQVSARADLLCHVAGQKDPWYGDKSQSTLWQEKKPAANRLHPTMKPVELVERALRNSSKAGDIVVDLFGGSGSTLIGCERRGRQGRLMELDPKYADVIVRRWQEYTGKAAVLDADGRTFDEIGLERLKTP